MINYDYEAREVGPILVDMLNLNDKGKLAIVEAREDETTRLFLKRLCPVTDVLHRNGWWDYFTITDIPCQKGYWLVVVDYARLDSNGYLNVHVTPTHFIGTVEDLLENSLIWEYFHNTRLFSSLISTRGYGRFNISALEDVLIEKGILHHEWESYEVPLIAWKAWLAKEVSLMELSIAIETPLPIVKNPAEEAAELLLNDENIRNTYPCTVSRIEKNGWKVNDIVPHLYNMGGAYWRLLEQNIISEIPQRDEVTWFLDCAEVLNSYYANKKEIEKAARKAARKAKK